MDLEQDYLIYAIEASLAFLAVTSTYLIDITRPLTLLALIPATILFGYTSYISRERFRPQAAISMLALVLVPVGGTVAAGAVSITLINVLTSVFASGSSFKDYYGSTSLPLLFTGLILGSLLFAGAMSNPAVANTIQQDSADFIGQQTEEIVNRSNMLESRKGERAKLFNRTSDTAFRVVKNSVISEMGRKSSLNTEQYSDLERSFDNAEKALNRTLKEQASKNIDQRSIDISSRVSDLISNTIKGKAFLLVVPAVTFGIYSVHPVVGIFAAIWASMFAAVNVRISIQTDSKELDSPSTI
ncbi:hypothetical protein AQV86_02760 [Nanohaloarchaea archaeon SG9]|nr:hypothetical protein AQV86_02760 [Nanohaloarchaea archaeon SG9]